MHSQNRLFGAILIIIVATGLGLYASLNSWGGLVFVSSTKFLKSRGPAAISRNYDFSWLEGSALKVASQKRLVTDARIIHENDQIGIELGHFVTKGEEGARQFACEFYDRMELTFQADGIADSGEKPAMVITAPCRVGRDLNRIAPVLIPVMQILNEKPGNAELSYPKSDGTVFRFANMTQDWPRSWILLSVRLYHATEAKRQITVSESEMREILARPFTIMF